MKKNTKRIITLILIVATLSSIYIYRKNIRQSFVKLIAYQLDKEREKDVGEYNIISWNNGKFQINHCLSENRLELLDKDCTVVLLRNISDYKIKKGKLYIISEDGYAVIDNNDTAFILITKYDELDKYSLEYEIVRNNKKIIYSKRYNNKDIVYWDNFNQFSSDEQKQLKKLTQG